MLLFAAAYLTVVIIMSAVAFAAYGADKRRAESGGVRFAEKNLHLLAFFGGWPGAWLAQRRFRHKTRKLSFQAVFWLVVVLHFFLLSWLASLAAWLI